MSVVERALLFRGNGERLVGVLHTPSAPRARGVLLIVGGPQYRVGSHRQFVLLARHLAAANLPVLRFDYRGMGDSEGSGIDFEAAGPDIAAAIDELFREVAGLEDVVLWGLCDAASAALMYAFRDARVAGLVLLNPWVRQPRSEARAYLRHYYLARIFDPQQLRRLMTGQLNVLASARGLVQTVLASLRGTAKPDGPAAHRSFVVRMLEGFRRFNGGTLFILSGDDLTAAEFKDEVGGSRAWREAIERESVTRRDFAEANHTFSTRAWRERVAVWTLDWIESL